MMATGQGQYHLPGDSTAEMTLLARTHIAMNEMTRDTDLLRLIALSLHDSQSTLHTFRKSEVETCRPSVVEAGHPQLPKEGARAPLPAATKITTDRFRQIAYVESPTDPCHRSRSHNPLTAFDVGPVRPSRGLNVTSSLHASSRSAVKSRGVSMRHKHNVDERFLRLHYHNHELTHNHNRPTPPATLLRQSIQAEWLKF